jgi:hypothetical protein
MPRPIHDPVIRCRRGVIQIIVRALREMLNGSPQPGAETLDAIDTLIADYGHELVQDTIREMQPD